MAIPWSRVSILKDDLRTRVSGDEAFKFVQSCFPDLVKKTRKGTVVLLDKKKEVIDDADVMRLLEKTFPMRVTLHDMPTIQPVKKGGAIRGDSATISSPVPLYEKIQFIGFKVKPTTVEGWTVTKKGDPTVTTKVKSGEDRPGTGYLLWLDPPKVFSIGDTVELKNPATAEVHELKVDQAWPAVVVVSDGPGTAPLHDVTVVVSANPTDVGYMGHATAEGDMKDRLIFMKNAIKAAHAQVTVDKKILKVFMGPEFYWRNADGAYPFELVPDIFMRMAEETRDIKYKDWLFVYGSAIGYLPHGSSGDPLKYRFKVTKVDGGNILTAERTGRESAPTTWTVKHPKAEGSVSLRVWGRIPEKSAYPWKVHQDTACAEVTKVAFSKTRKSVTVTLTVTSGVFSAGEIVLEEPVATELFNLALVQKGGPPPIRRSGLREALIYKEFASHIDFVHSSGQGWYDESGVNRKILLEGNRQTVMLPTEGAVDVLSQNRQAHKRGQVSEINASGYGGGSVVTIDGITFGVEVCRDHLVKRLRNFYFGDADANPAVERGATKRDPRVQVQLIPSWGAWIERKAICCVENGLIFNVDGAEAVDPARVYDRPTSFTCEKHPSVSAPANDICTQCRNDNKFCPTCGEWPASACTCTPKKPSLNQDMMYCVTHSELFYPGGTCSKCGAAGSLYPLKFRLTRFGSEITVKQKDVAVDPGGKKWEDYFEAAGLVDIYEPAAIPPPQKAG